VPTIPALPEAIREVPDVTDRYDDTARKRWLIWRDAAIAYRTLVRRQMDGDPEVRKTVMRLADADPAYALLIFGVIHEPRMRGGRGGVQPFIPFGWQVDLIRWFGRRLRLQGPWHRRDVDFLLACPPRLAVPGSVGRPAGLPQRRTGG
jgi:hypothetical protein